MWVGVALAALVASAPVAARAEGPGIKLGDHLLLHLGLAAEFRYDSNVFFQTDTSTGAFLFRLLPSVDLATRRARGGGGKVDFRLHAGMAYSEFISERDQTARHRSVGVDAGALLTLFPDGRFNFSLFDNYVRTSQPPYSNQTYNLDRDSNQLGLRIRYSPGGRRLTLALSYTFGLDFFETPVLRPFDLYTHAIALHVAWKFFPKTSLYLAANETIHQYAHPEINSGANDFLRHNSYPFHVELGVMGLITVKLTLNAWVGYGNAFFVEGPSANTAVGGFNLAWRPTMLSVGTIGYKFDFSNSLIGNYYDGHQVFISWTQLIWRFTAAARLAYNHLTYEGVDPTSGGDPMTLQRIDDFVAFDLRLDYPFKPWLIASAGYNLQYNHTDARLQFQEDPMAPIQFIPLGYLKNEVWLRLAVLY
jgi:hypothetical protein